MESPAHMSRRHECAQRPTVVAIGGSLRTGSSTEQVLRLALRRLSQLGADTELYSGQALVLPPYEPGTPLTAHARQLLTSVRRADAIIIGSPGYHGSMSGLVKNAIDYLEELRNDDPPYLDGKPVACVTTAHGWQAAVNTLTALRATVHALRGWPTPYGVTLNVAASDVQIAAAGGSSLGESVEIMVGQLLQFRNISTASKHLTVAAGA